MNISDILAISGLPGLYRLVGNRANGLIVEDLKSGKRKFVSSRKHQFSPMESISIYTLGDTVPLRDIFAKMRDQEATVPPVPPKSEQHVLFEYFEQILPDFDEDRVKVKDIKKIIQWYAHLKALDLLTDSDEEE